MTNIGNRIKQIRIAKNLTQEQFSNSLNLKRNTIATYETGVKQPSERTINDICRIYNVNREWLETGKGEMFFENDKSFGEICSELGADDPKAREAILKYYDLNDSDKKLFWDFIERFVNM